MYPAYIRVKNGDARSDWVRRRSTGSFGHLVGRNSSGGTRGSIHEQPHGNGNWLIHRKGAAQKFLSFQNGLQVIYQTCKRSTTYVEISFNPLQPNVRKTCHYYTTLECQMSRKVVTYDGVQNCASSEAQKRSAAFLTSSLRNLMYCRCSFTKTRDVQRVLNEKLRGKMTSFYNSPA